MINTHTKKHHQSYVGRMRADSKGRLHSIYLLSNDKEAATYMCPSGFFCNKKNKEITLGIFLECCVNSQNVGV